MSGTEGDVQGGPGCLSLTLWGQGWSRLSSLVVDRAVSPSADFITGLCALDVCLGVCDKEPASVLFHVWFQKTAN